MKTEKMDKRMSLVASKFPCKAAAIPVAYRGQLPKMEKAGLAVCGGNYEWTLTEKGRASFTGRH